MMQKNIIDFHNNKDFIKYFLQNKISKINNNCSISLNTNIITSFDWKLFSYNIKNSEFARANLQILLKNNNLEALENMCYCYFNIPFNNNYIMENKTKELVCIILYYYLNILENRNINNIHFDVNTINQFEFKQIYCKYYNDYYLPRMKNQNYKYKILDKGTNKQEWEKAIAFVKEINLDEILRNIIISINVGETLFNRENLNELSNFKNSIILNPGHAQCWLRSTIQLLNSAIELCPKEIKDKLKDKNHPEYILVKFLEYLRQKSINIFENIHYYSKMDSKLKTQGISLHHAFEDFERIFLTKEIKDIRNNIPSITEAKQILYYLNKNSIVSNITIALPILDKLFPEIKYLFPEEQLNTGIKILDNNMEGIRNNYQNVKTIFECKDSKQLNYYFPPYTFDNTCKHNFKPIPRKYSNMPYFFMLDDNDYCTKSIEDQIKTHQYRIGLDNNGNIVIYTLKGLHLSEQRRGICTHFWTHAALDNNMYSWALNDSLGYNSNPNSLTTMHDIDRYNADKWNNWRTIQAFMYRKVTQDEIIKYMN